MATQETKRSIEELQKIARRMRCDVVRMTTAAGSGHPTSSMSCTEILAALYFGGVLRYDPQNPEWPDRDRFIMSKGHASPGLYAALGEAGYFPTEQFETLRQIGSPLEGHPNMRRCPGVEASTGSLGQGLSIGMGMALAARIDHRDYRVYVLIGDGESEEGQVWEAIMAAVKYKVDNLVAILDRNKFQQTGPTREVLDIAPMAPKWQAFGWHVREIDGHNLAEVLEALEETKQVKGRPSAIIAQTEKGHGIIPLLRDLKDVNYHGKALSAKDAVRAYELLGCATGGHEKEGL